MGRFRKIIFWCHLAAALFAGLVIFTMSVTGVLLMYEKQMIAAANARTYRIAVPEGAAPSVDLALDNAAAQNSADPSNVVLRARPDRAIEVSYGRERTIFVNPYTGELLGEGATSTKAFFQKVTEIHRYMAASGDHRAKGKAITGACNLAFLFIVLSGVYLWWPRRIAALRSVALFQRGLRGRARDFNWHNVIGIWSAIPLVIIVFSATVISYPWASNMVYRAFGEEPPIRRAAGGGPAGGSEKLEANNLDNYFAVAAEESNGWGAISLSLPVSPEGPFNFSIDAGTGGQPHKRSKITIGADGEIISRERFADNTRGSRMRSILRFAHTGEAGGIIGQTIAGFATAGAAVLVWTGYALAWRRWRSWRKRRRGEAA